MIKVTYDALSNMEIDPLFTPTGNYLRAYLNNCEELYYIKYLLK